MVSPQRLHFGGRPSCTGSRKLSQTSFSGCTMVSGPSLDGKTTTGLVVEPSRWDVPGPQERRLKSFPWNLGMRWNKGLFPWWTYPDSLSLGPPGNRHTPFHYFFRYPREFDVQVYGSLSLDLLRSRLLYPSSCPFPSARGRGVLRSRSKDVLYGVAFIFSCLVFAHDKPCHLLISCFPRYSLLASSPMRVLCMASHKLCVWARQSRDFP